MMTANKMSEKAILKMKRLLREQQEAVFQERGLATFYGSPCPQAIVAREQSLEDLDKRLDDLLEQIEESAEYSY